MSAHDHRADLAQISAPSTAPTRPSEAASAQPSELDLLLSLQDYGAAVAAVGAALGLTESQLARAEGMDRLETALSVPLDTALEWDVRLLADAFHTLGDDLRVDLTLSGLDVARNTPNATLRADGAPEETLADFLGHANDLAEAHGEDATVEIRLFIGKVGALSALSSLLSLRQEYLGTAEALAETKLAIWYHRSGFESLARLSALSEWERMGLAREEGRAVVALCDARGYLAGPALEIIGARNPTAPRWLLLSRAAWRQFQEQTRRVRLLRDGESLWIGGPRAITPAHLRLTERESGLDSLAAALAKLRAGVAAAYLASSAHETQEEFLLRFAGARPSTCRLLAPEQSSASDSFTGALAGFAAWAFEHGSVDKLLIARECLARELPSGAEVSLARLEATAGPAFEAARANLALYLRGRTLAYFQAREQAEEAVGAYTLGVRKGVSDLTADVVNNVYATVGLLVGVVIAGLIQPRVSIPVQRLGAGLYTAYVVFVLWFLLRARWQRYRLERAEVVRRLDAMVELSETERAGLREQAGAADAHFERYFALAWRIYVFLACLGALYFLLLLTPLASHIALPHGR